MAGNLNTARNILDSVREGRIDIGPLDAYWHMLIARHAPQLTSGISNCFCNTYSLQFHLLMAFIAPLLVYQSASSRPIR